MFHISIEVEEELMDEMDGLRRSGDFLGSIVDSISDPLLVIGLNHNIVFANSAARRVYDVNDPVGMRLACYQVIHRIERPCETSSAWIFVCPLRYVVSAKGPVRLIHKYLDNAENEVIMEISACPIFDDDGEVAQVIEIIRDITKVRQEEEKRERLILDLQKAYAEFDLRRMQRIVTKRSWELVPVCMCCKKMRNSNGTWKNIEEFIRDYWRAEFTHGVCPECEKKLYDADKDGNG
jgi:transcriptional regulator with PAS, ATPase and Fis domain